MDRFTSLETLSRTLAEGKASLAIAYRKIATVFQAIFDLEAYNGNDSAYTTHEKKQKAKALQFELEMDFQVYGVQAMAVRYLETELAWAVELDRQAKHDASEKAWQALVAKAAKAKARKASKASKAT